MDQSKANIRVDKNGIVMTSHIENAAPITFYNGKEHPSTYRNNLMIEEGSAVKTVKASEKRDITPPPYRAPVLDPHQNSYLASRMAISTHHKVIEY
jgi:hypothetical protein